MRQYTISMDEGTYGEGITFREMCAMAEAEADAIRARFPDAEVHTVAGPVSCAENDPDIAMYSEATWDRILSSASEPESVVAAWQREAQVAVPHLSDVLDPRD
jgi:hypothetical protein